MRKKGKKKEKKGSPDEIKRNAGLKIFEGQIMKQRVEACPRIVFPVSFVCAIIVRPFVLFSFFHDGLFPWNSACHEQQAYFVRDVEQFWRLSASPSDQIPGEIN